jgi:signal transduction histidine kinase
MLELIILALSVVANFVLALVVYTKDSQNIANKRFAIFSSILITWAAVNYISIHPLLIDQIYWIRLDLAWGASMMYSLLLMVNIFPSGVPFVKRLTLPLTLFWLAIMGVALSPWLFTHVDYSAGNPQPVPGWGMIPFALYTASVIGTVVFILSWRFATLRGKAKEYLRYGLIGITTTFFFVLLFNFVFVVSFHNTSFVVFTPVSSLLFAGSFAYGIVRARLFDVRLIITRVVAYALLLLFVGAMYGFITAILSFVFIGVRPVFDQIVVSTLVVGTLILFVEPLRKFFNHITRTVFYQDDYDTKNVLDELASILVRATETGVLATGSIRIIQNALKSDFITLLLIEEDMNGLEKRVVKGKKIPLLDKISSVQLQHHVSDAVMIESTSANVPNDHFRLEMQKADVAVVVRLETRSEIVGYWFFGYKSTGSAYTQRDIDLIRIAGDELAIAIQNTLRFEQIQEFNKTLRQRIEEATKELRTSNEQLQRLDAAKDEFVSMASHQLRTPLTSVKGYISMVLEGDAGKITAVQRQLLGEAFTSSERMVHLINDFLNVSRLQTGKFIIEAKPIDLAKITMQEVDSLQTTANAHDLKLQYRSPSVFPILYIDEGKIRQVIMNFIDNAIYYSHEHTTIHVELTIEEGEAVLRVRDTGIGVPKTEQSHLFSKFFRATNARKQRPDGTGVGLFLAKKVIVAHGGTIVFESKEDEGSTFGFRLPIKKLSVPADNAD